MLTQPTSEAVAGGLRDVQRSMDGFVRSRGWYADDSAKPQEPSRLASSIVLEAGEVLECFQWSDEVDSAEVAAELADVILYVAQLANVLDIDLESAVERKQRLNEMRWPAVGNGQWDRRLAS